MSRGFVVNGPTLVQVVNAAIGGVQELGITDRRGVVTILPRFTHQDLHVDDYGDTVPPEVMWKLADCIITMTLIHWDQLILDKVIAESNAGGTAGTMVGAGALMGNLAAIGAPGNHFISLGLNTSFEGGRVWRFPTAYLAENPVTLPIGVKASAVRLNWRAIPYKAGIASPGAVSEVTSAGTIVWDHQALN